MTCAHDYTALGMHLARYLHSEGVVLDPEDLQAEGGELPAIYLGGLPDKPDRAVGIIGPWEETPDSPDSPTARFMVVVRAPAWDLGTLAADWAAVGRALRRELPFSLTADQDVMECRRVISDPPVQDSNRRWQRVGTYSARLHPPNV